MFAGYVNSYDRSRSLFTAIHRRGKSSLATSSTGTQVATADLCIGSTQPRAAMNRRTRNRTPHTDPIGARRPSPRHFLRAAGVIEVQHNRRFAPVDLHRRFQCVTIRVSCEDGSLHALERTFRRHNGVADLPIDQRLISGMTQASQDLLHFLVRGFTGALSEDTAVIVHSREPRESFYAAATDVCGSTSVAGCALI